MVFTSASTVKGFAESTRGADYTGLTAACIGKQTKAAADKLGMDTYMAEKLAIEHLIRLVEEINTKRKESEKHGFNPETKKTERQRDTEKKW